MTARRYTDENDQPLEATPIYGPGLLHDINDLIHGDTTISAAVELIRTHPDHGHNFPTNTGLVLHVPALNGEPGEEDIEATLDSMLATLRNDLLEDIDDEDDGHTSDCGCGSTNG